MFEINLFFFEIGNNLYSLFLKVSIFLSLNLLIVTYQFSSFLFLLNSLDLFFCIYFPIFLPNPTIFMIIHFNFTNLSFLIYYLYFLQNLTTSIMIHFFIHFDFLNYKNLFFFIYCQ